MTSTELPDEESAAFSDDEMPADLRDDPFFKQNLDSDENTEKQMKGKEIHVLSKFFHFLNSTYPLYVSAIFKSNEIL